jgi:hypothetical protein
MCFFRCVFLIVLTETKIHQSLYLMLELTMRWRTLNIYLNLKNITIIGNIHQYIFIEKNVVVPLFRCFLPSLNTLHLIVLITYMFCNGDKDPSKSVLDVGVDNALMFSGFDEKMFFKRGGKYQYIFIEKNVVDPLFRCFLPSLNTLHLIVLITYMFCNCNVYCIMFALFHRMVIGFTTIYWISAYHH